jgi:hypothetical protein
VVIYWDDQRILETLEYIHYLQFLTPSCIADPLEIYVILRFENI